MTYGFAMPSRALGERPDSISPHRGGPREPGEHRFDRIAPLAERHVAAEQPLRSVVAQVVGVIALIDVQARGRPDCAERAGASAISAAIEVCKAAR